MIYELGKLFNRDAIKFNFLQEILDGKIKIFFALNNSSPEDYINSIRSAENRVKVYGNCNLSEDPDGKILTVRVAAISSPLKISLEIPENISGKTLSLYRSANKSIEKDFELSSLNKKIEIVKLDSESYSVKIEAKPAEPSQLQNEFREIDSRVKADEEIIKHYDENKIQEIQEIFNEIKPKLSQAEEKIKILISAREDETKRIESAVR